jgi:prepilin-type N-terminal cleavage/methylation domain-containing protein
MLRDERGFTLPELLIALVIALIVSFATFSLIEVVMRKSGETQARVAAAQRGRMAMDTMVRQIRSQVCLNTANPTPPMSPPAGFGVTTTGSSAVFYTDFTDGGKPTTVAPELHVLTYDAGTRRLIERDYLGTVTLNVNVYTYTYPTAASTPARTKVLLENVVPVDATTPIFTYYTYNTLKPPRPDLPLAAPATGMVAADLARIARIDINFRALTTTDVNRTRDSSRFQDEIYVRAADPNDEAPTPTCA